MKLSGGIITESPDTRNTLRLPALIGVLVVILQVAVPTDAQYIYWTDEGNGKIQRCNMDGTGITDVVTGLTGVRGLEVDSRGEKLYWTIGPAPGKIQSASWAGDNQKDLVTGLGEVNGVTLDWWNSKIYWAQVDGGGGGTGKIMRANLDGSNVEVVITNLNTPQDLIYDDNAGGRIWWSDPISSHLGEGYVDGTVVQVDDVPGMWGLRADRIKRILYWTSITWQSIVWDNSREDPPVNTIVTGLTKPTGIDLDFVNLKIYWVDETPRKIMRSEIDGSDPQDFVTGLVSPRYVRVYNLASGPKPVRAVPFSNKYLLMGLLALLGGWLVYRKRKL